MVAARPLQETGPKQHGTLAIRLGIAAVISGLPVLIWPLHDMLTDGNIYALRHNLIQFRIERNTTVTRGTPYHKCRPYGKSWKKKDKWIEYDTLAECKLTCAACTGCTGFTCRANSTFQCPWRPSHDCGKHRPAGPCPICVFHGENVVLKSSSEEEPTNYFRREGTLAPLSWAYFVVMIVYNVWRDAGSTVRLSLQTIVGTWIACLNIYVLNGLVPGGVPLEQEDLQAFALYSLAFLDFFVVTVGLLWLNVDGNTRTWALSYHVWFLMCFLNPQDRSFSEAWHMHRYTLEISHGFMAICSGVVSVLVTLVPRPMLAGSKAVLAARATGRAQHEVLRQLCLECVGAAAADGGCRAEDLRPATPPTLSALPTAAVGTAATAAVTGSTLNQRSPAGTRLPAPGASLQELLRLNGELEQNISAAYFECFGLGASGFRWRQLCRHNQAIAALGKDMVQLQRWREGCAGSPAHQPLAFGGVASASGSGSVPLRLAMVLDRIAGESAALVLACSEIVADGGFQSSAELGPQEVKAAAVRLEELCGSVEHAVPHGILECDHGSSSFHTATVAYVIGRIGLQSSQYANDLCLLDETYDRAPSCHAKVASVCQDFTTWMRHSCSTKKNDSHSSRFVLRNTVSLSIAFAVGFVGFGTTILPYSSGLPVTVALLVSSTQLDDAVQRNLARLQGVTVGTAVGQVAHGMLGRRTLRGAVMTGSFLFLWETACGYVYFASSTLSYTACLCAAFAAFEVLKGLSNSFPDDAAYAANYHTILYLVCAILIMTFVDLTLLHRSSRGSVAKRVWMRLFHALSTGFAAKFAVVSNLLPHADQELMHSVHKARDQAVEEAEAYEAECQVNRVPWLLQRAKAMTCDTDRNVFGLKRVGNLPMDLASRLNAQLEQLCEELTTLDEEFTGSTLKMVTQVIGSGLAAQSATAALTKFIAVLEDVRELLHVVLDQQIDEDQGRVCLRRLEHWRTRLLRMVVTRVAAFGGAAGAGGAADRASSTAVAADSRSVSGVSMQGVVGPSTSAARLLPTAGQALLEPDQHNTPAGCCSEYWAATRASIHEGGDVEECVAAMQLLAEKVVAGVAAQMVERMPAQAGMPKEALGTVAALLAGMTRVYRHLLDMHCMLGGVAR